MPKTMKRHMQGDDCTQTTSVRDEDAELIAAVAERRDHAAFVRLVERHQAALLNLACYLNGSRDAAEETVQEVLMILWSKADRFKCLGPGSVRAWLMRLTANEGLRQRQRRAQNARLADRVRAHPIAPGTVVPDEKAEHDELRTAVRRRLDKLKGVERDVVALYYGAGLDQQSIAEKLSLSQQVVSYKLKHVLKSLREDLLRSGFAASLPLLDTPDLGGALHTGVELSGSFAERLTSSLLKESARSTRVAAVSGALYVWVAALVLLGSGSLVWWLTRGVMRTVGPTEQPSEQAAHAQPEFENAPFRMAWDFRERPPEKLFEVLTGTWEWKPPKDGWSGGMEGKTSGEKLTIRFPLEFPHRPLRMRLHSRAVGKDTQSTGAMWLNENTALKNDLNRKKDVFFHIGTPTVCEYLFVGRLVLGMRNGEVVSIREYDDAYSGDGIALYLVNHHLERIEIEEIDAEEQERIRGWSLELISNGEFKSFKIPAYTYPRRNE